MFNIKIMNFIKRPALLFILLLLAAPAAARAQDPSTQPASRPRNPFKPEGFELSGGKTRSPKDEFQRLQNVPQLPEMKLLGIIKMQKKAKPAAMIEVKGVGSYLIHEGDKLGLTLRVTAVDSPADRDIRIVAVSDGSASRPSAATNVLLKNQIPVVLRIDKIAGDGVVVEVGTLGEYLVIR